jgi:hypothetical protein
MREAIFDNIAKGSILAGLALFGLRGLLPDIAASQQLAAWLASGAAVIVGFAIGQLAYKCRPVCDPQVCRIT